MRDSVLIRAITSAMWAIVPEVLDNLVAVVFRHSEGDKVSQAEVDAIVQSRSQGPDRGDPRGYSVIGSTAVIPVGGVIAKHASMVNGSSQPRGTATDVLRRALVETENDDTVGSRLFLIESPGGTVDGVQALSDDIHAAAAGGGKPVWACFDDLGASAAYWIGSQASKVFASTKTTEVGSIGVYCVVPDYSRAFENKGVKVNVVRSVPDKGAGIYGAPLTDAQKALFQERIDSLHRSFVEAVARGRGRSAEQAAAWATGKVWDASKALQMGLVDGIRRPEELVSEMNRLYPAGHRGVAGGRNRGSAAGAGNQETVMRPKDVTGRAGSIQGVGGLAVLAASMAASTAMGAEIGGGGGGLGGELGVGGPGGGAPQGSIDPQVIMGATSGLADAIVGINGNAAGGAANGSTPVITAAPTNNGSATPPTAPPTPATTAAPANPGAQTATSAPGAGAATQGGDQLSFARGQETARRLLLEIEAACTPFLDTPGVAEYMARAKADANASIDVVRAEVLKMVGAAKRPTGDVQVGRTGWERARPAIEMSLLARARPGVVATLEAGGTGGEKLARKLGFSPAGTLAAAAVAISALADAEANGLRSMTLEDLARASVHHAGIRVLGGGFDRQRLFEAAVGNSTSDFPLLLSNLANKTLLSAFMEEPVTWPLWCHRDTSNDYKPRDLASRSEAPNLKLVPEGDTADHMSFNERKETIQNQKYGRKFKMTYEMFRNDDLGAFTDIPAAIGQAARRLPEDLVFQLLTQASGTGPLMSDGKRLFHVDHLNIASPAAALAYDAVTAAFTAMRTQRGFGADAAHITIEPKYMLVPPALEFVAAGLAKDQYVPGSNGDKQSLIAGRFTPLVCGRIAAANDWYVTADPNRYPLIVVQFLDGREEPTITQLAQSSVSFLEWEGMVMGVGVAAAQHEAGYFSAGS